jgi:hypothetical protein
LPKLYHPQEEEIYYIQAVQSSKPTSKEAHSTADEDTRIAQFIPWIAWVVKDVVRSVASGFITGSASEAQCQKMLESI